MPSYGESRAPEYGTERRDAPAPAPGNSIWQPITITALAIALGAMAFVQVNMRHEQERTNQMIATLSDKHLAKIDALDQRTAAIEQDTGALHTEGATNSTAFREYQKRMAQARAATLKRIEEERNLTAQQLAELNQTQEARFGTVSADITSVKGNLDEAKSGLETVSTKLDRTVGDLGVQSGLVARNHDELMELRRKGERDYAEFDLKKLKDFSRISDVSLKLTKADPKNQRYTVSVMVADKRLEKRDKTALEPVQLYLPGGHKLVEIVVWDVNKDRVIGYVSTPKT